MDRMIADSAERLFSAYREQSFAALPAHAGADAAPLPSGLWAEIEEAGFPLALLSEDEGGFGLPVESALALVRMAAEHAVAAPLGETMIANLLLARAGLDPVEGIASFTADHALTLTPAASGWQATGRLHAVPYGRMAQTIVVRVETAEGVKMAALPSGTALPAHNLVAEPQDTLVYDLTLPADAVTDAPALCEEMLLLGALLRAQGMAGALSALLGLTVDYANERKQFGRPIGKFQAIQQELAVLAGETAAAGAAAEMAARAFADALAGDTEADWRLAVAAAKLRAGEAAGKSAAIAHQVIAAIGFSHEYPLHALTRRLWAWRDECGSEAHWARWIGETSCARGAEGFWPLLTQPEIRGAA
ncbi:acyl-CoA dehydrogenase [Maritimibacter alkaliphilus]|uniref:acyl-CoA dehydrogenase n=1 Tax=Maritimibacter alkaliphilus TaxID=404236 RepID=UPI001C96923D|nr:acyl-CoA dehydrogenase [Maritimibacter alkaliphilus]MBY6092344.1 acyl-CoA dehydrogenase [Maritimibacter alkaliphilus]